MNITKQLTRYNFTRRNNPGRIKYIVIHYFGGLMSVQQLATYWAGKYVGASAHYGIGHRGECYQMVEDGDVAWHCGAKNYRHASCRNSNSIGIEVAVRKRSTGTMSAADTDWYFEPESEAALVELVAAKMKQYNIPLSHVLRHYDVTGKLCPNPYVVHEGAWNRFLGRVKEKLTPTEAASSKGTSQGAYQVRVTASVLNIRSAPSAKGSVVGTITDQGVYTIIEERDGWGLLKSKVGWISLRYTKRA